MHALFNIPKSKIVLILVQSGLLNIRGERQAGKQREIM